MLRQQRAARQQAQKPQKPSAAPAAAPTSKKRKANDDVVEERKRTRTEEEAGVPAGFFDAGAEAEAASASTTQEQGPASDLPTPEMAPPPPPEDVADPELDAFMEEMSRPRPPVMDVYAAGAVVEAKPMSAAEVAAQAREEQSAQRARKDEEMEGEKEDAARALEDEFDEMDGLEERVKRLRAQREALRSKHAQPLAAENTPVAVQPQEDDDSDLEDGDWDDWRFRPA